MSHSCCTRLSAACRSRRGYLRAEIEQYQRSIVTFRWSVYCLAPSPARWRSSCSRGAASRWRRCSACWRWRCSPADSILTGWLIPATAFSARTRDRMLEIMRDSRLGTHGGLALIFVLVAKVLVVGELLLRDIHPIAALAAACAVGRGWRCC